MNPKYPSLNLQEIAEGMLACRSNARELLEEAAILLSRGCDARAYALLHTACEELAKFSILELGGKRLAQGNSPPWKRFWQRFRSHDSKIAQLNVQLLYLLADSTEVGRPDIVQAVDALFDHGLAIRNSALYVDIGPDGKLRQPSDIDFGIPLPILHTTAKLALDAADRRGGALKDIERSLQGTPHHQAKQISLEIFAAAVRRAKVAGVTEDKVLEVLKKAFDK